MIDNLIPFNSPSAEVRGLAPGRAALARIVSSTSRARDELETLQAGRARLAARLKDAEALLAKHAAEIEAEADSIVAAIKRGIEFTLSFARMREAPVPDLRTAQLAIEKADAAITGKEAEIATLAGRVPEAVRSALIEDARNIAEDYDKALAAAATAAARLEGLAVHLGQGCGARMIMTAPGFRFLGDEINERPISVRQDEIRSAAAVWKDFSDRLASNPRADAARHLRFPEPARGDDNVTYGDMTAAERRIVDIRNSH